MKNGFNAKKIMVVILVIILIAILSLGLYTYYNKNDDMPKNIEKNDDTAISSIYNVFLKDSEQEFSVGEKKISLKLLDNELYINNNKIANVKAEYAYITEQVVIFTYKGDCHEIITYVVDADGRSIPFTKNNYQLYDFRMLDDKCVAAGSEICPCNSDNNCTEKVDISFTYTGSELIIK